MSKSTSRQSRRVERVWTRLHQAYGTRLFDTFGTKAPESWAEAIEDLTDEQISYGLRQVIREQVAHPPTLGQFTKACQDMPATKSTNGPSVQELLCAFCSLNFHGKLEPWEFSGPWTYLYREWIDPERPKHLQRCAECTGVLIPLRNGDSIRVNVIDMQAEPELLAKAQRSFLPGPRPSERKLQLPDMTR